MKPYKACACRDPETGRQFVTRCPELKKKSHGGWYVRYEVPGGPDGSRRRRRIGPYKTEREAKDAIVQVLSQAAITGHSDERKLRLGAYLDRWHADRVSEAENGDGGLKRSTLDAEAEAIDLYLKPGLGHIRLGDLRNQHVRDLYAAMRKINRPAEETMRSDLMRALLEARASRDGKRISTRPLTESRIRRVNAVLSAALNDAAHVRHIIPLNPAAGIFRSAGSRNGTRTRPLLWTAERTAHWERTGQVPARVMTWTQAQAGAFLDFSQATGERLHAMFHLDIHYGLRRSELAGLERPDMSVQRRRVHVRQAQAGKDLDTTKTSSSDRQVIFDEQTALVLRAWERRQREEMIRLGPAYADSGRYFTYEDGRALRPQYVSSRFDLLVTRYAAIRRRYFREERPVGWIARRHRVPEEAVRIALAAPLPPLNFHGIRHGAATMLMTAQVQDKVVSEILGHASTSFTKDVYTVVAEELSEEAARTISAFVSRRAHASAPRLFGPTLGQQEAR